MVCGSERAGDWNNAKRLEGAAVLLHYRRAGCQSADATLTYAARLYRTVVKDPAPLGHVKTNGWAADAKALRAERAGAERSEPPPRRAADAARQGRGRSGDEHTPTPDPPEAGRWRRCNLREMLLTKRRSEPFTRQKGSRSLHGPVGALRKKGGLRGRKTR